MGSRLEWKSVNVKVNVKVENAPVAFVIKTTCCDAPAAFAP